ncbi:MAG TPA: TonB-dependent receptor [Leptospiraceae bacterium]|nr:TonB-dependent receptor [Leptospiraceae bacterium]HMW07905.1 TonB-dependent receptor [Leptospiraceae bacterium]HMX32069.1 TonB-dependent receptor [Leptospiraceae bacterium]HMY31168.1 TonB-dependent receptor [Leptospiraceae bacterium]HMZ65411.1 TonB-dependent receptor [Leptospiraceae bacterium]
MKKQINFLILLLMLVSSAVFGQAKTGAGSIQGDVLDAQTAEPMFGVTAVIRSISKSARTDLDGKFTITGVPDGEYDIEFIMQGMDTQKRKISVSGGKPAKINVAMGIKKLDTVVVEGRAMNDTESSLLKLQKKASTVSDGISAQAIAKTPDSSAGDAARRITGITLVGGKYVFVRGLGERYSNTLLNGVPLPSPEPNKRVVPLDLFPSALIKNIIVSKTFIPEDSAEFAGGTVKIETKDYPDKFFLKVGFSMGYNNNTTGKQFQTYSGGGQDWLGLTAGNRERPDIVSTLPGVQFNAVGPGSFGYNSGAITAGSLAFNNQWSSNTTVASPNKGFNISTGNVFNVANRKLGVIFALTYGNDLQFREERDVTNRVGGIVPRAPVGGKNAYLIKYYDYNQKIWNESVNWGSAFNTTYEIANGQRVHWKNFFSVNNDKEVWNYGGSSFASGQQIDATKLNYIMRNLYNTQLGGDHIIKIADKFTKLDWKVSQSEAFRNQPDMRDSYYQVPLTTDPATNSQIPQYNAGAGLAESQLSKSRFFSRTLDINRYISFDYEIPFTQWGGLQSKFKVGYSYLTRERGFDAQRYYFRKADPGTNLGGGALTPAVYPVPPEAVLNPFNRGVQGYYVSESTRPTDTYEARQKLTSKYAQVDMPLTPKLRFIGGVRNENNYQVVSTVNPFDRLASFAANYDFKTYAITNEFQQNLIDPTYRQPRAINKNTNTLPSANFVYSLDDRTNIRLAYTETITRPDFREMSSFEFTNILGGPPEKGNPYLKRSYIHNYDLRYEFYPKGDDLISFGVFRKNLSSPIEKVMEVDSQFRYTYTNAKSAYIQGAEFEARKGLDFISEKLEKWSVGFNMFLIKSEVTFNDWLYYQLSPNDPKRPTNLSRPLQGQSPYVYNVNVRYKLDKVGDHTITVLYNEFGKRINAVGGIGIPDTYERPVGMLDMVYNLKWKDKWDFKLAARNLTDTRIKIVQEDPWRGKDTTINSYRLGPTITFSASYNF